MSYRGVVRGKTIDLDEKPPFDDGTVVDVSLVPATPLRTGSPRAVLQLAGTLSAEEAEAILQAAQECRKIDQDLWRKQG